MPKKGATPDFQAPPLTYEQATSLCHLMATQNAHAKRLKAENKPILSQHCETTKEFFELLISYVDKNS